MPDKRPTSQHVLLSQQSTTDPGWFKASATLSANCSVTVLFAAQNKCRFPGGTINGQQRADWRRHDPHQRRLGDRT